MRLKELIQRIKELNYRWDLDCDMIRCGCQCPISALCNTSAGKYYYVSTALGIPIELVHAVVDASDNKDQVYRGSPSNLLILRAILLRELIT